MANKPTNHKSGIKLDKKGLSLVERCKLQMSSSMLRLIDEDLYNQDSKDVQIDRDKFEAYHKAYTAVRDGWPIKPIDHIVKFIKKRILGKKPIKKLKFADIGCGNEPLLKKKLPPNAKISSFDLVSTHPDITEANMSKLPLDDASMNVIVYSLSLMATNLGKILLEGKRVLKVGGSILIVEVTSRFEGKEKKFATKLEKLGLKQRSIAQLKPNGFFTFIHLTKEDSGQDYPPSTLNIVLKPCSYKSR